MLDSKQDELLQNFGRPYRLEVCGALVCAIVFPPPLPIPLHPQPFSLSPINLTHPTYLPSKNLNLNEWMNVVMDTQSGCVCSKSFGIAKYVSVESAYYCFQNWWIEEETGIEIKMGDSPSHVPLQPPIFPPPPPPPPGSPYFDTNQRSVKKSAGWVDGLQAVSWLLAPQWIRQDQDYFIM